VIPAAEAVTWFRALRHAKKRRGNAVPAPGCAYVTSGGPLVTTRAGPGGWRSEPAKGCAQHEAAAPNRRPVASITIDIGVHMDERPP
jgi:hypothetical protein